MENMKIASHGKVSFRELNLTQGGNNVRWLNEREDRILQTSLNSLERARQKTLYRLQHEVKGLHHTLREQVAIRSPQLSKNSHFPDNARDNNTETKRSATLHTGTSLVPLYDENSGSQLVDAPGRRSLVEDVEDSTLEQIALKESSSFSGNLPERKTNNQDESAWTRKLSSSTKTAIKRPLAKQPSNSSEHSSSSATLSVPRRKISVTDPPTMKELSPRLRKTSSQSTLQVNSHTSLNLVKARSTEMINIVPANPGGNVPLKKLSSESINHVASPLFYRRKLSQHQPQSLSSSPPRPIRKISCPSKMQHQLRVHQEEVIPLQLSRDNTGSTSRAPATMGTDLPKLSVSYGVEQVPQFDEGKCLAGCASHLGLHVEGMDCTLQEKVNNFLRSLERTDAPHEPTEETSPK